MTDLDVLDRAATFEVCHERYTILRETRMNSRVITASVPTFLLEDPR